MAINTFTKLWDLLTSTERRDAVVLLNLMFVGMVLETFGIGLVIPALTLMTQADFVQRYPVLLPAYEAMGRPSQRELVLIGVAALIAVYVIKTGFLSWLCWRQMQFVYKLQADLSNRLFAGYLGQEYEFHLLRNSAQLIRNAMGEVNLLTQNGVLQALILLSEALVIIGIFSLLVYVEPLGAMLAVSTLGLAGWAFYHYTRIPVLKWGERRQYHEGMRIQHLQQGLGGVKAVKLFGRESEFVERYRNHTDEAAEVGMRAHTLQLLPRLMLEFLAVVALGLLVLVLITKGRPLDMLLPTIGVFAAAAFRILPSVNRIVGALQVVRFTLPVVDTITAEMANIRPQISKVSSGPQKMEFRRALTLDRVSYRYPQANSMALQDVSLVIEVGTSVGFIGSSGAGKSTLIDVVLGLLSPSSGRVCVDGVDIAGDLNKWQGIVGYVPQSIYLTDDSLRRNIAFGVPDTEIDDDAVLRALRAAQLDQFVLEMPDGLATNVGERGVRLSGGQLQRIGIARALYHDPQVLVLDEATSALDAATEKGVMDAVKALHGRKTVLIVAHRLSTVRICDYVYRLDSGRIAESGPPSNVIDESVGLAKG